jgi:hypothetical protein
MNKTLNVSVPVSFDDGDMFEYLDSLILPAEPTDEKGLDDEASEISMNFIKWWILKDKSLEIDEETTEDSGAFEDLALRMENYLYLKRHMPHLYEKSENNL